MAKLIYSFLVSLDGYVADAAGRFDWAIPDEEVHAFINDLQRPVGTYLYGRRLYEDIICWETDPTLSAQSAVTRGFAGQWQATEKVVYSTTLQQVSTGRTRIEPTFDPDALLRLKATASHDLTVGGPGLAAHAVRAGSSTSTSSSSPPPSPEAGNPSFRREFESSSTSWRSTGSAMAWSTSATAP